MKKFILFYRILTTVFAVAFSICALFSTLSCTQFSFISTEDTITVSLPLWPPKNNTSNESKITTEYPELLHWVLKSANSTKIESKIITKETKNLTFTVTKNQPFVISLLPITENKISYFMPAGYIYPFNANSPEITWEQGFLATQMTKILQSKTETGVSKEHITDFLHSFNWKKAQETIEKKIYDQEDFYNPWLIDTKLFLENLSYGYFKSSYLNITNCYTYDLETLLQEEDFFKTPNGKLNVLSSFIPENQKLANTGKMKFKKNQPQLISDAKQMGVVITGQSSKKVSKEIIFLPIFIEDYELFPYK